MFIDVCTNLALDFLFPRFTLGKDEDEVSENVCSSIPLGSNPDLKKTSAGRALDGKIDNWALLDSVPEIYSVAPLRE